MLKKKMNAIKLIEWNFEINFVHVTYCRLTSIENNLGYQVQNVYVETKSTDPIIQVTLSLPYSPATHDGNEIKDDNLTF